MQLGRIITLTIFISALGELTFHYVQEFALPPAPFIHTQAPITQQLAAAPTNTPATSSIRPHPPLPQEIKAAVNRALRPEGVIYSVVNTANGASINVSKRALSVSTAVIDEHGNLHISDHGQPLP